MLTGRDIDIRMMTEAQRTAASHELMRQMRAADRQTLHELKAFDRETTRRKTWRLKPFQKLRPD